jgi:hypothetical protein
MEQTKTTVKSKTNWATLFAGLISLAQLFVYHNEEVQAALMAWIPAPWNALVPPIVGVIIILLTAFGIASRNNAETRIKGLW